MISHNILVVNKAEATTYPNIMTRNTKMKKQPVLSFPKKMQIFVNAY